MISRLFATVAAVAVLAACQPTSPELTEEQKAALADSVSAMHAEMWQPWLAADLDRGMPYFLNSPDVVWGVNSEIRYGYDNIDALFRPIMDGLASQEFTVADRRVVVLARDVVCVIEHGTLAATDTAGVTLPASPFAMTTIWVRRDGEWKIHLGHESVQTPESSE
ncbi:MAG: SgcJ/EcaC family oxidoreductase [Acidimicrobiia bacterium]